MVAFIIFMLMLSYVCHAEKLADPVVCAGYVHPLESLKNVDMSGVQMGLFTNGGKLLTFTTQANPHNGYYFIPVYEPGIYEIRAVAPTGWSFEPESHTIEVQNSESCSESVNFRLTGFSVFGRTQTVSTLKEARDGLTAGPRDLRVLLKQGSGDKQVIREAKTDERGEFAFDRVAPGEYTVQLAEGSVATGASKAASQVLTARVGPTNADLRESALIIVGYPLSGNVVSANEPVADVDLFLYSVISESELASARLATAFAGCDRRMQDDEEIKRHVETFAQSEAAPRGKTEKAISKWARVCAVRTSADGQFRVESVPNGDYLLAARYRNAATSFGISPRVVRVAVRDAPVAVRQRFRIAGFALTGRVLLDESEPLLDASVTLTPLNVAADDERGADETGEKRTRTDATGTFRFDNAHSGEYRLSVVFANGAAEFDERRITVSPTTAQLAPIRADRVRVCGRVELAKGAPFSAARTIRFQHADTQPAIQSDEEGRFCIALPRADYEVRVGVTPAERERGLSIAPAVRRIQVRRPLLDAQQAGLVFRQFRAAIRGEIRCLAACGSKTVVAKYGGNAQRSGDQPAAVRKLEKVAEQQFVDRTERRVSFEFADLLPGSYIIELDSRSTRGWCWSNTEPINVVVSDSEAESESDTKATTSSVVFDQTGYRVALLSSHAFDLRYELDSPPANAKPSSELVRVQKGAFAFCVQHAGTYRLTPESECLHFAFANDADPQQPTASSSFSVSTDSLNGLIAVNAIDYVVAVSIHLTNASHQPILLGSANPESEKDVKAAPALSFRYTISRGDGETEAKQLDVPAHKLTLDKKRSSVLSFDYITRMPLDTVSLDLEPSSSLILFDPPALHFDVAKLLATYANKTTDDGCPSMFGRSPTDRLFTFQTNRGVLIDGRIEPAVPDAQVRVRFDADPQAEPIVAQTDANGAFRCGPVRSGVAYSLEVAKPGFELRIDEPKTQRAADRHTYLVRAVRLVSIAVRVLDATSGEPLRGVLASLSSESEAAFHAHKFTQADGRFVLDGLRPATYYLSAVLKEYEFEPVSTRIDLRAVPPKSETEKPSADGEPAVDHELTLRGKRVAYSVYGVVVSLNGDAEPGVLVEAVPHSALLSVETCTSDADGAFRLSGLKSNQSYTVRVRDASGSGNPVERVFPARSDVLLVDADASNVRFVVVRRPAYVELSVEVQLLEPLPDAIAVPVNLGTPSASASAAAVQYSYVPTNMAQIPANLHLFVIREATHEIVARHAVRSSLIFYSRDAVPIDNQLYFIRLATTDTHAIASTSGDDELLMFRANGSSRHFALPYREPLVRSANSLGRFTPTSRGAAPQRTETGSSTLLGSVRMVLFAIVLVICAFVALALVFGDKQVASGSRGSKHGRDADGNTMQKLTLRTAPFVIGDAVARYTLLPLKEMLTDAIIWYQSRRGNTTDTKRRESPTRREPSVAAGTTAPSYATNDDSELIRRKQQKAKRI